MLLSYISIALAALLTIFTDIYRAKEGNRWHRTSWQKVRPLLLLGLIILIAVTNIY
jgi:hypothetical protein